jgi:2-amino-4-hydroxy-6-hydroxymethyldihydropteridine diphosphokinase
MANHKVYIALGSNIGDRIAHLQSAVNAIENQIGTVLAYAAVYETPAWGFEGHPFLNSCLVAESAKQPEDIMSLLLDIETAHGRTRNEQKGYTDRTLDLDLLMVDEVQWDSTSLQLPHPSMYKRRFVLQPLSDIAPSKLVPGTGTTVKSLLDNCEDPTSVSLFSESLKLPVVDFLSGYGHICIEGNIGSGKTSLAQKLAADLNANTFLERFAENPFLPKFYDDPKRYAFPLEMSFLADRFKQQREQLEQLNLFQQATVADYNVHKSLIFAQFTLSDEEYQLYRNLFYIMMREVQKPDVYVLLKQNTQRLLDQIKKRGRSYERNIDAAYLDRVRRGYQGFVRSHPDWPIVEIDISDLDFVASTQDYTTFLQRLKKSLA